MNLHYENKTVIVTGSARGIGRRIALTFAEEGANVVVADLDLENGNKVAEEINQMGTKGIVVGVNVTKLESVENLVNKTLNEFNRIDVMVHDAVALSPSTKEGKTFMEHIPEEWDIEIQSCYYGWLNMCYTVLKPMISQKSGVLLGILSDGARVGERAEGVYDGAKAAIGGHARSLVKEISRYGIRVNCVAPSWTETELTASLLEKMKENLGEEKYQKIQKKALSVYPLAEVRNSRGKPEDIANAVVFLCSDKAEWVTGQTLSVNGGYAVGPW